VAVHFESSYALESDNPPPRVSANHELPTPGTQPHGWGCSEAISKLKDPNLADLPLGYARIRLKNVVAPSIIAASLALA